MIYICIDDINTYVDVLKMPEFVKIKNSFVGRDDSKNNSRKLFNML